jgi:hypothetical protein
MACQATVEEPPGSRCAREPHPDTTSMLAVTTLPCNERLRSCMAVPQSCRAALGGLICRAQLEPTLADRLALEAAYEKGVIHSLLIIHSSSRLVARGAVLRRVSCHANAIPSRSSWLSHCADLGFWRDVYCGRLSQHAYAESGHLFHALVVAVPNPVLVDLCHYIGV